MVDPDDPNAQTDDSQAYQNAQTDDSQGNQDTQTDDGQGDQGAGLELQASQTDDGSGDQGDPYGATLDYGTGDQGADSDASWGDAGYATDSLQDAGAAGQSNTDDQDGDTIGPMGAVASNDTLIDPNGGFMRVMTAGTDAIGAVGDAAISLMEHARAGAQGLLGNEQDAQRMHRYADMEMQNAYASRRNFRRDIGMLDGEREARPYPDDTPLE